MPGTGPLRRSSAPARIKALVRKSCFKGGGSTKPRRSKFFRPQLLITRCGVFGQSFLSMGKANGIGSGRFKKADQELTPEDLKFSYLDGL
jgi:hypothetical protein